MIKKLAISVSHDLREELGNKQLICYVSNSVKKKNTNIKMLIVKKVSIWYAIFIISHRVSKEYQICQNGNI